MVPSKRPRVESGESASEVNKPVLVVVVIKYLNKYNIYFDKGSFVDSSDRFILMSYFNSTNV